MRRLPGIVLDAEGRERGHRPAPPSVGGEAVDARGAAGAFSASMLQPRDWCDEFHDFAGALVVEAGAVAVADASPRRRRSWSSCRRSCRRWPAIAVPSGCEPVRMSCMFGVSPRPLTTSPFSVSAVCLVRLLAPCSSVDVLARRRRPWRSATGPVPMRSRALTAARSDAGCGAQVGVPGAVAGAGRGRERGLAVLVGAGEAAEVGALARVRCW